MPISKVVLDGKELQEGQIYLCKYSKTTSYNAKVLLIGQRTTCEDYLNMVTEEASISLGGYRNHWL